MFAFLGLAFGDFGVGGDGWRFVSLRLMKKHEHEAEERICMITSVA